MRRALHWLVCKLRRQEAPGLDIVLRESIRDLRALEKQMGKTSKLARRVLRRPDLDASFLNVLAQKNRDDFFYRKQIDDMIAEMTSLRAVIATSKPHPARIHSQRSALPKTIP